MKVTTSCTAQIDTIIFWRKLVHIWYSNAWQAYTAYWAAIVSRNPYGEKSFFLSEWFYSFGMRRALQRYNISDTRAYQAAAAAAVE